ncbi:MAG TPA: S-layer homology domain-containing protein [Chloroflexia bacterium]|nr:S-layer homology domain-containing protein [Chloroflexia bacterium]
MNRNLLASLIAGVATFIVFGLALGSSSMLAGGRPSTPAVISVVSDTTTTDFNAGTLFHTELAHIDDGSVDLQAVGLAQAWQDASTANLPARFGHGSTHVGNYLYVCAGQTAVAGTPVGDCWASTIQADHTLSAWRQVSSLPVGIAASAMTAVGSTVYVIGGVPANGGGLASRITYRATVNAADGSLSAWTQDTQLLPISVSSMGVTAINGHIYVVGGARNGGAYSPYSYVSTPTGSGSLTSWITTTQLIGNYAGGVAGAVLMSYSEGGTTKVYIATGLAANGSTLPDVYSTAVNADGTLGAWQQTVNYQRNLTYAAGVAYGQPSCGGGNLYLTGGVASQGTAPTDYVAAALLDGPPDLNPSGWYDTQNLLIARSSHTMVVSDDGWLYVIDGQDAGGGPVNNIRFGATACAAGGGSARAPSGYFISRTFDTGSPNALLQMTYNSTVPSTSVNMTFSYRFSNFSDFHDVGFGNTATVASGISNTTQISLPTGTVKEYAQYEVTMSRADSALTQTPALNWVELTYDAPPTPTPPATGFNVELKQLVMAPNGTFRPVRNHPVIFNATVRNTGLVSIPAGTPIEVDIYTGLTRPPLPSDTSTTFGRVILPTDLQVGQEVVVPAPWTPPNTGSLILYGWVNRLRYFNEYDYSDNIIGPTRTCVYASDGQSFTDVPTTTYFYAPVEYLVCLGIISGYSDGTFRPYNTTTRGQFTKILTNGMAWPITTPAAGGHTYADVLPGSTYFVFVETAQAHGAITGYPCGGPNQPCDSLHRPYFNVNVYIIRGDIVKYIALAKGWTLLNPTTPTFRDVPATNPYYRYVETVSAKGVISGYNCGGAGEPCPGVYFRPNNNAVRGQIAKILYISFTQR